MREHFLSLQKTWRKRQSWVSLAKTSPSLSPSGIKSARRAATSELKLWAGTLSFIILLYLFYSVIVFKRACYESIVIHSSLLHTCSTGCCVYSRRPRPIFPTGLMWVLNPNRWKSTAPSSWPPLEMPSVRSTTWLMACPASANCMPSSSEWILPTSG